jgi:hypothetical protein
MLTPRAFSFADASPHVLSVSALEVSSDGGPLQSDVISDLLSTRSTPMTTTAVAPTRVAQPTFWRNGRDIRSGQLSVYLRDNVTVDALALTRELLRDQTVPQGLSPRAVKAWREADGPRAGGPGAEMALWFRAYPQHLDRWESFWRGVIISDPATLDECITALVAADADEEKAKAEALRNPTPANLRRWARALDLQAARSRETARSLRDTAAQLEREQQQ